MCAALPGSPGRLLLCYSRLPPESADTRTTINLSSYLQNLRSNTTEARLGLEFESASNIAWEFDSLRSKLRFRIRVRVRVRLQVNAGRAQTRISVGVPRLGLLLGVRERVEHRVGVRVFNLSSNSSSRSSSNSSTSSTSSSRRSRSNSNSTDRVTFGPFLVP